MSNQSTIDTTNAMEHLPEASNQRDTSDEPTMLHYVLNSEMNSVTSSIALCGAQVRSGSDRITRPKGHDSWVVCPICEFLVSMSDDKPRFKQWMKGTYQLKKNAKEASHE